MRNLVVLSHLMSKECLLGEESISRAKLAIKTFGECNFDYLVTIGWAYRSDCSTPISNVVAEYILRHSNIADSRVISCPHSRDTVGDAYFLRRIPQLSSTKELVVVTSDYHVARTEKIFTVLLPKSMNIIVLGAATSNTFDENILKHEEGSISAFERTFEGADFDDTQSIYEAMISNHPFYNGDIYPKFEFEIE